MGVTMRDFWAGRRTNCAAFVLHIAPGMKLSPMCSAFVLLSMIGLGCAQGTQAPDSNTPELGQAGNDVSRAGAGGHPFQNNSGGTAAGGQAGVGASGTSAGEGGSSSALAGAAGSSNASSGASAMGGSPVADAGSGGAGNAAGSAGSTNVAGGSAGGGPSSQACAPHVFAYADPSHTATSVGVSGSFDAWSKVGEPLSYDATTQSWQASVMLDTGSYQYKFVVDGSTWLADPNNTSSVGDGYGGVNSLLVCP